MTTAELIKRLAAVEREIADLKADRKVEVKAHPIYALERIHGTFKNDAAFREATCLGRKWRDSQSSSMPKTKAKRK